MRYEGTWRGKGIADGAESISRMAAMLEEEAWRLKQMRIDGVGLAAPVDGDYATLETDDPKAAEKYGLGPEEEG